MFEGLRRGKNYLTAILLVYVLLVFHGCAVLASPSDVESKHLNFWKPHLLYLQSVECKSLYVELNAVEGCEPSQETITILRHFLEQYCDKPGGIQIISNPLIPLSDSRVTSPEILSLRQMNILAPSLQQGPSAIRGKTL